MPECSAAGDNSCKSSAATLLIDAGNSQVKWLLAKGRQLQIETLQQGSSDDLYAFLAQQNHQQFARIILASVAADFALPRHWQSRLERAISPAEHRLLRNAYPAANQLGVDRWLAMLGARLSCDEALCVVDLGTATTLDAVSAEGQHLGGWIIPGLATSRHVLQHKGHLLKHSVDTEHEPTFQRFADNTRDAIASGTLHLQIAAIERFIEQMAQQGHTTPRLFLSGGWAQAVAGLLSYESVIDPLLVFRGLTAQYLE